MVEYQWGIFWADLDPVRGAEQAGLRPVLVISSEDINMSLPIVTIVSLTSVKPGRKVYPVEAYLYKSETGLPKDSIAMTHQIRAISKGRLVDKCGELTSDETKEKIRNAIRIYLDM
jgi:Growth inhibitor